MFFNWSSAYLFMQETLGIGSQISTQAKMFSLQLVSCFNNLATKTSAYRMLAFPLVNVQRYCSSLNTRPIKILQNTEHMKIIMLM